MPKGAPPKGSLARPKAAARKRRRSSPEREGRRRGERRALQRGHRLTLVGGVLFGYHHALSRSLLLVSIEHALFGQVMFTVGLGRFFCHGSG
jgi:hypothetical protein